MREFFSSPDSLDLDKLAAHLDGLSSSARVEAARSIGARDQARLFEAAQGHRIRVADFVSDSTKPMTPVIHYGRNSLPIFRIFEKRFCRPTEGGTELWGYNQQAMGIFTGPGYFIARDEGEDEVVIDYWVVPKGPPPVGWPTILSNSARLSRFVYHHTRDYMRRVSKHVSIGRARRNDKIMDNWFVLCREG